MSDQREELILNIQEHLPMDKSKKKNDEAIKQSWIGMALNLKYLSLLCLIIQCGIYLLLWRFVHSTFTGTYTTTILVGHLLLLVTSLLFILYECKGNMKAWLYYFHLNIIMQPLDNLKVAGLLAISIITNKLMFRAASNLYIPTYMATYELKILSLAVFSVIILQRSFSKLQWFSIVLLSSGLAIIKLFQVEIYAPTQMLNITDEIVGIFTMITVCLLSGFRGIYTEKLIKQESLVLRTFQFAFFGSIQYIILVLEDSYILEHGFFHGYSFITWLFIVIQVLGNFLSGAVLKYADKISGCFAISISVVITTFLFPFDVSSMVLFGNVLVILANYCYIRQLKTESVAAHSEAKMKEVSMQDVVK